MAARRELSPLWFTTAPSWTSALLQCRALVSYRVSHLTNLACHSCIRLHTRSKIDRRLPECLHGMPSAGRCGTRCYLNVSGLTNFIWLIWLYMISHPAPCRTAAAAVSKLLVLMLWAQATAPSERHSWGVTLLPCSFRGIMPLSNALPHLTCLCAACSCCMPGWLGTIDLLSRRTHCTSA